MGQQERDPNKLYVYRADPEGKYGGKDRLETQPLPLDKTHMQPVLRAMAYLRNNFNLPHPDPRTLTALALKEGRPDFGINTPSWGHSMRIPSGKVYSPKAWGMDLMPTSLPVLDKIKQSGQFQPPKDFSEYNYYYDKQGNPYDFDRALRGSELAGKAQKRNKDISQVWNPGDKKYHVTFKNRAYAADAEKNADLRQFIHTNLGIPLDPPTSMNTQPVDLPDNYRMGGRVRMI
jgi:hypothetical protein